MTAIKVPFIDLQQRFVEEREELMACVERVLAKGHLVMTPEVFEFEQKVVEYTGALYPWGGTPPTEAEMNTWVSGLADKTKAIAISAGTEPGARVLTAAARSPSCRYN